MTPKVSVIVPVYNNEEYLRQCFDSIAGQTLREIEVLLVVESHSSKESKAICGEYIDADNRFRLIWNTVHGLSVARNIGLKEAKGEYIGFVDSDDFIDTTMYERLYTAAKEHSAEIVVCGVYRLGLMGDISVQKEYLEHVIHIEESNRIESVYYSILSQHSYSACNKLYQLDFLCRLNHRAAEGIHMGEDLAFNLPLFCRAETTAFLSTPCYYYRQSPVSMVYTYPIEEDMLTMYHRSLELLSGPLLPVRKILLLRLLTAQFYVYGTRGQTVQETCKKVARFTRSAKWRTLLLKAAFSEQIPIYAQACNLGKKGTISYRGFALSCALGYPAMRGWQWLYPKLFEGKKAT